MPRPALFISYPRIDDAIAKKLKECIITLAPGVDPLLDQQLIAPGSDFETDIAAAIRRSRWFVLICNSDPGETEKNFDWCYFEAGQFRQHIASLGESVEPTHRPTEEESPKRLCVLYDKSIPRNLRRWNVVKVGLRDNAGVSIQIPSKITDEFVTQYSHMIDSSPVCTFLQSITSDRDVPGARDISDSTTQNLLRTETLKLIHAFQVSKPDLRLEETPISHRLTFTIEPYREGIQSMRPDTSVTGHNNALSTLFGIAANPTSWQTIIDVVATDQNFVPLWVGDLAAAVDLISRDRVPIQSDVLAPTKMGLFLPVITRFIPFSSGRKEIHIVFAPAQRRDPLPDSGASARTEAIRMLLATLTFSARFMDEITDLLGNVDHPQPPNAGKLLVEIDRKLTVIEQEAQRSGLPISRDPATAFRAPLLNAISNENDRNNLRNAIHRWRGVRQAMITSVRGSRVGDVPAAQSETNNSKSADEVLQDVTNYVRDSSPDSIKILLAELSRRFDVSGRGAVP